MPERRRHAKGSGGDRAVTTATRVTGERHARVPIGVYTTAYARPSRTTVRRGQDRRRAVAENRWARQGRLATPLFERLPPAKRTLTRVRMESEDSNRRTYFATRHACSRYSVRRWTKALTKLWPQPSQLGPKV
ncbi:hypothetical protein HPB50_004460 [Hyalomma asiaticum]|uniref:Uncharacterized protein n=1 Tax=Hyalomma asiaticum TaxID=266040 RepID=A0ACB7TC91_HYAAI|nr:hypothetical protein HPB50_004460 [Hyalomma asiaticum]